MQMVLSLYLSNTLPSVAAPFITTEVSMIWNLIGTIGSKVLDIVDDVVEDKDEANKLKFQIQRHSSRPRVASWRPRQ